MKTVIYTDLDGTLLDHETYSYKEALPAIEEIRKQGIPLIFCTSKTRSEIEEYRKKLGIYDPFIPENGGAIYIPKGYFRNAKVDCDLETDNYEVIRLGTPYAELLDRLGEVKTKAGCSIRGFADMSAEEVSKDAGIDLSNAQLAKQREFDEAFTMEGDPEEIRKALSLIESFGLRYTKGGRYYHIMGASDKGKAVEILADLYKREYVEEVRTIGLGDSKNDFPMLEKVDIAILIQKPDGTYAQFPGEAIKTKKPGPAGWNQEVKKVLYDV